PAQCGGHGSRADGRREIHRAIEVVALEMLHDGVEYDACRENGGAAVDVARAILPWVGTMLWWRSFAAAREIAGEPDREEAETGRQRNPARRRWATPIGIQRVSQARFG